MKLHGIIRVDATASEVLARPGLFDRLRAVAMRHDERLRSTLSEKELEQLGRLLEKVRVGVGS